MVFIPTELASDSRRCHTSDIGYPCAVHSWRAIPSQESSHVASNTAHRTASNYTHLTIILSFGGFPHHTRMSGCTLRFTRNSPLRTTLVDETTGDVKYKIKTPIRIARSVTRITKFKPRTETPLHPDVDGNSDSGRNTMKEEKSNSKGGAANEIKTEPLEISDEIARIYWKWFSPNRFIFRGKTATRREFLPKCGKMNGYANSLRVSRLKQA